MKSITIREAYDWLYLEEHLTKMEWEHLTQFFEQKYQNENVVEYGNKRLRFINLTGVIQLKTVRIEILPKLDLHQTDTALNRRALLNMLSLTKQLPVQLNDQTISQFEKVDLAHILARLYITELFKAVKRGLYRGYTTKSENMNHLKGRLLISPHIRKNAFVSVNAFCEYDELSPNVLFNQVLKAALKIIYPYVQQSALKTQTLMIFEMFDEVDDVYVNPATMDTIQINRQNQHYEAVLQLALAIIHSTSMGTGASGQIAFTFLFKINDLYEGYVGECLKRVLPPSDYQLDLQHRGRKLLIDANTGRKTIQLKPDFVISRLSGEEPEPIIILDTKWKNILYHSQQGDIYQMYAYITSYKTAERCIILYPRIKDEGLLPKWRVPESTPVKHIEVQTIRLDSAQHTVDDLKKILSDLDETG
ncbi:McrC family protein [Neobacillus mesonae]|uniref:McrC family protein n=1 Tax=Neobacillus mesonae TaxID=1193713 RepID=UPI00203FE6C5|nr:McrC family protein [Neobacillus mesonae]MCM3570310.1 McrC family protein [Neobacillus mesonae]